MDEKRSRASKRKITNAEEGFWDCSVCTYRNSPEAFKCEICDVRKGTSTRSGRKPRINPAVVMQQVGQQVFTPPLKKEKVASSTVKKSESGIKREIAGAGGDAPSSREPSTSKENSPKTTVNNKKRAPRLKNIDRSSGRSMEVTVGNVTVVITDYQPKKPSSASSESSLTKTASSSSLSPATINKESSSSSNTSSQNASSPSKPATATSTTSSSSAAASPANGEPEKAKQTMLNGDDDATKDES